MGAAPVRLAPGVGPPAPSFLRAPKIRARSGANSLLNFVARPSSVRPMNARVTILLAAACVLAGAHVGCRTSAIETGRNGNPPIVMELDPTVSKAIATIRTGDEVRFVLPSADGPEFIWQIVSNDPRYLRQTGGIVYKPGATKEAGTSTAAFIAQRPSRSFIRFAYVPDAGGKETEIVDAYEILVTVRQ